MKVHTLIERLQAMPPDADVMVLDLHASHIAEVYEPTRRDPVYLVLVSDDSVD